MADTKRLGNPQVPLPNVISLDSACNYDLGSRNIAAIRKEPMLHGAA